VSITLSDPDLPKVKIRISNDKCKTPMICPTPCYRNCPQGVFIVAANPIKVSQKWTPISNEAPGDYMIIAPMIPKCTGCKICMEKCPTGALKIKFTPVQKEGAAEQAS
jgi:ferredoxin